MNKTEVLLHPLRIKQSESRKPEFCQHLTKKVSVTNELKTKLDNFNKYVDSCLPLYPKDLPEKDMLIEAGFITDLTKITWSLVYNQKDEITCFCTIIFDPAKCRKKNASLTSDLSQDILLANCNLRESLAQDITETLEKFGARYGKSKDSWIIYLPKFDTIDYSILQKVFSSKIISRKIAMMKDEYAAQACLLTDKLGKNILMNACGNDPDSIPILLGRLNDKDAATAILQTDKEYQRNSLTIACQFSPGAVPLLLERLSNAQATQAILAVERLNGMNAVGIACWKPSDVLPLLLARLNDKDAASAIMAIDHIHGLNAVGMACSYHPDAVPLLIERLSDEEARSAILTISRDGSDALTLCRKYGLGNTLLLLCNRLNSIQKIDQKTQSTIDSNDTQLKEASHPLRIKSNEIRNPEFCPNSTKKVLPTKESAERLERLNMICKINLPSPPQQNNSDIQKLIKAGISTTLKNITWKLAYNQKEELLCFTSIPFSLKNNDSPDIKSAFCYLTEYFAQKITEALKKFSARYGKSKDSWIIYLPKFDTIYFDELARDYVFLIRLQIMDQLNKEQMTEECLFTDENGINALHLACELAPEKLPFLLSCLNDDQAERAIMSIDRVNGINALAFACQKSGSNAQLLLARLSDEQAARAILNNNNVYGLNILAIACQFPGNNIQFLLSRLSDEDVAKACLAIDKRGLNALALASELSPENVPRILERLNDKHAMDAILTISPNGMNALQISKASLLPDTFQLMIERLYRSLKIDDQEDTLILEEEIVQFHKTLRVIAKLSDKFAANLILSPNRLGCNDLAYACYAAPDAVPLLLTRLSKDQAAQACVATDSQGFNALIMACSFSPKNIPNLLAVLNDKQAASAILNIRPVMGLNLLGQACSRADAVDVVPCILARLTDKQAALAILHQDNTTRMNVLAHACINSVKNIPLLLAHLNNEQAQQAILATNILGSNVLFLAEKESFPTDIQELLIRRANNNPISDEIYAHNFRIL